MRTDFVLDALEQALYARQPERDGSLVCHSDRGSQYVSIRYTERLAEAGIEPSVGSKGDSYDNALAETINGLYKGELIHRRAPWRTRNQWSWQPRNGWLGSITTDCLNTSGTYRPQKLRQTTTGNSPVKPPRWWPDLNQTASTEPGAIQTCGACCSCTRAGLPLGMPLKPCLALAWYEGAINGRGRNSRLSAGT
jgi:transposase InsO family protein